MSRTLVIIFGGMDSERIDQFGLKSVIDGEYQGTIDISTINNVQPDELLATFLTGCPSSDHGVQGSMHFTNKRVQKFDNILPNILVSFRRWLYSFLDNNISRFDNRFRRWIAADLDCDTIFEKISNSKPICIPSYNPEPQWCIYRNTIRPNEYPDLGEAAARELIEKNLHWRKSKLTSALEGDYSLIMIHFQFIDSIQHLYGQNLDDTDKIREAYHRMDDYAAELRTQAAEVGIENIIFMSEHGRPHPADGKIHYRNPFFNSTWSPERETPTLLELHDSIYNITNNMR